jgi:hypothetical protein
MTDNTTVIEIETKLMNELAILKDKNVGKERKKQARTNVKRYEKFMNDIDYKHINGHKYPVREVPPETTKEELLKLIDSGYDEDEWYGRTVTLTDEYDINAHNLEGLMITLEDKGWSKAKEMKPDPIFK